MRQNLIGAGVRLVAPEPRFLNGSLATRVDHDVGVGAEVLDAVLHGPRPLGCALASEPALLAAPQDPRARFRAQEIPVRYLRFEDQR